MSDLTYTDWADYFDAVSDLCHSRDQTGRIAKEYFQGLVEPNHESFPPVTHAEVQIWFKYCCDNGVKVRPSLRDIKRFVQELRAASKPALPPSKITDECHSRRCYQAIVTYLSRGECQMFEGLLRGEGIMGAAIKSILTGRVPPRDEVIRLAQEIRSQFSDDRWAMFRRIPGPYEDAWVDVEIHNAIYEAVQNYEARSPCEPPLE